MGLFESAANGIVQLTMKFIAQFSLGLIMALHVATSLGLGAEAKASSKTNSPSQDELFSQPKVLQLKILW